MPFFHHVDQALLHHARHGGPQYLDRRRGLPAEPCFIRGIGGEIDGLEQHRVTALAVRHQDTHQLGECGGAVSGAADGSCQGRG